ncbi:hypothetical protein BDV38DRAFT_39302 [Aspergillus pseudotamarii]|uniref:Uncharacterized protein n=1 Tax=Aspergillus pseudotamarii TaxID=132259 RepID=A0A5N6SCN4_ASPPS|nr:uncharacterized protein BDV38DRAFT_39302 [Aspergillus pseudotamarii]KAE8130874.1 hypothetical protein BDV38DRAFT_39302 [Aspergillus pseudotamarii]
MRELPLLIFGGLLFFSLSVHSFSSINTLASLRIIVEFPLKIEGPNQGTSNSIRPLACGENQPKSQHGVMGRGRKVTVRRLSDGTGADLMVSSTLRLHPRSSARDLNLASAVRYDWSERGKKTKRQREAKSPDRQYSHLRPLILSRTTSFKRREVCQTVELR